MKNAIALLALLMLASAPAHAQDYPQDMVIPDGVRGSMECLYAPGDLFGMPSRDVTKQELHVIGYEGGKVFWDGREVEATLKEFVSNETGEATLIYVVPSQFVINLREYHPDDTYLSEQEKADFNAFLGLSTALLARGRLWFVMIDPTAKTLTMGEVTEVNSGAGKQEHFNPIKIVECF